MKGYIVLNPYDTSMSQKHKTRRMVREFDNLGVFAHVVSNDTFLTYVQDGKSCASVKADFVLYFDKDKYTAELLEKSGIRVFNSARALAKCDDKMLTHIALADSGIPMPTTLHGALCYNPQGKASYDYLKQAADILGFPMVIKECYGSYGEQVYLVKSMEEMIVTVDKIKNKPYLFQQFVEESSGKDMRVIVIGGKTVCGMIRQSQTDFRSNVERGGQAIAAEVPDDIKIMCERAAKIIGLDYCGIDVLLGKTPMLCEVNSNAMFNAMEQVTNVNVARKYCEHIIRCVNKG